MGSCFRKKSNVLATYNPMDRVLSDGVEITYAPTYPPPLSPPPYNPHSSSILRFIKRRKYDRLHF